MSKKLKELHPQLTIEELHEYGVFHDEHPFFNFHLEKNQLCGEAARHEVAHGQSFISS